MWDLTVPGNNDHDFYVLPGENGTDGHHYYVKEDGVTAVLVHNCGDATHIVPKKLDQFFATQDEARSAALQAHGVSDEGLVETRTMYGTNSNLTGPRGEPWEQLDVVNDEGDLVTIDHHANGHYFSDTNEYALPHYHGPGGEHYLYGDSRVW